MNKGGKKKKIEREINHFSQGKREGRGGAERNKLHNQPTNENVFLKQPILQ